MLLNFQKRFAPLVADGSKVTTIRSAGLRTKPKAGDIAHCYTGLRTTSTELLGRYPIEGVADIRITFDADRKAALVLLDGEEMNADMRKRIAQADGFEDWAALERWFAQNHPEPDFFGWMIRWQWLALGGVSHG